MIGALITAIGLNLAGSIGLQAANPSAAEGKPQPINQGEWIKSDDYPPGAVLRGEQGLIVSSLGVDATGVPRTCRIVGGAETAILGDATCKILLARAKFVPAKDAAGNPIASEFEARFRWATPGGYIPPEVMVAIDETAGGYRCALDWEKRRRTLRSDLCKSLVELSTASGKKRPKRVRMGIDNLPAILDPEEP